MRSFFGFTAFKLTSFYAGCYLLVAMIFMILVFAPFNLAYGALNCETKPSCEELGYTLSIPSDCTDDYVLFCPFDMSYKKCITLQNSCPSETYPLSRCPENGVCSICGNGTDLSYRLDSCTGGFEKNGNACSRFCSIGDVFYADGSCGSVNNYSSGKTPVGIVFNTENGGRHGKIINLKDLKVTPDTYVFDPSNPYGNTSIISWGLEGTNVTSLSNLSTTDMLSALKNNDSEVYNGKTNTAAIAGTLPTTKSCTSLGTTIGTYNMDCAPIAAAAALKFYPAEGYQSDSLIGAGKWYLPSLGEWLQIYGFDPSKATAGDGSSGSSGDNKTIINKSLTELAAKGVEAAVFAESWYWSANEYTKTYAWTLHMPSGSRVTNQYKGYRNYVRVAAEF